MTDETTTPAGDDAGPGPDHQAMESEARSQGWRPKEEYHGPEDTWVDAPTFVKRGQEILPIVQSHNRRLKEEVGATKAEIAALKATMQEFAEHHRRVEQTAYQRAMEDLKAKRHAAIRDGDAEQQILIEQQMEVIHSQSQTATGPKVHEPAPQKASAVSEEMQEWQARNRWFGKDTAKTRIAIAEGEALQAEQPHLEGEPFLRELDRRLLVEYPGKFGQPKSRMEGPSTGGSLPSSSKKRSYANLPAEAKAACDNFVAQGWVTQEQYVKEYDWD